MDIHEAERMLAASPDHRVLKRIPAIADWGLPAAGATVRRGVYVDVESTGLTLEADEVIECALLPFDYDPQSGAITRVREEDAFCGFRQPSFPIPAASTAIHGVTHADVAGATIDAGAIATIVTDAHLIIAHNAGFDRPTSPSSRRKTGPARSTTSPGVRKALPPANSTICFCYRAGSMTATARWAMRSLASFCSRRHCRFPSVGAGGAA